MDAETLLRYESSAASISDEYAGKLEEALKDTRLTHWRQVLQTMLASKDTLGTGRVLWNWIKEENNGH